jgi:3-oxoacyl-[acyl-carrier protein] reductase
MKTAMIWGASGGMGRAITAHLDDAGWTVVGLSRHPEEISDLTPHAIMVDVTDPKAVEEAIGAARQTVAEVDLWVYAVGTITSSRVNEMAPETWARLLGANLTGAYLATHYSLPLLAPQAHLVYLGAYDDRLRLPGLTAYAASKAGLEAFTDALAKEQRRLKVTLVRPAAVKTALWDDVPFKRPAGALEPEVVAARILRAFDAGETGQLDL